MNGLRLRRVAVVRGASLADRGVGRWESVRAAVQRDRQDRAVTLAAARWGPAVTLVVQRGRAAIPVVRLGLVGIQEVRRDRGVIQAGRPVSRELPELRLPTWVRCSEIRRPIS